MQLLLQTFSWLEEPHEKAQGKNNCMKKDNIACVRFLTLANKLLFRSSPSSSSSWLQVFGNRWIGLGCQMGVPTLLLLLPDIVSHADNPLTAFVSHITEWWKSHLLRCLLFIQNFCLYPKAPPWLSLRCHFKVILVSSSTVLPWHCNALISSW